MKGAELSEFTFPTSGIKVHVPLVSPAAFVMRLQRKYPAPKPPMQEVDYGSGHKVREFNYAHPDYKESQLQHARFLETEAQGMVLARAIRGISLNAEQREMVKEWKEQNGDFHDAADRDEEIFFEEFCVKDENDLLEFMTHVTGIDPSEEEIQNAVDGF